MFNRNEKQEEATKKFWASVEAETGLPVIEYALGQYITGYEEYTGPDWGLIYLNERSLYFRHFPTSNWLSAIVSSSTGGGGDQGYTIELPIAAVTGVDKELPPSFWKRILRPFAPAVTISYEDRGETRELKVTLEHRGEELYSALKQLIR